MAKTSYKIKVKHSGYKKKTTYRRRAPAVLRVADTAMTRYNTNPKIYKFHRSVLNNPQATTLTADGTWSASQNVFVQASGALITNTTGAIVGFRPADMYGVTDFTGLFQKIRIPKIKFTVRMTDSPGGNQEMPTLYMAKYSSAELPTLGDAFMSKLTNGIKYQFSAEHRECSITIYPALLTAEVQQADSNGFNSYLPSKTWIDAQTIASTGVQPIYTGIAVYFDNVSGLANGTIQMQTDTEFTVECKETA